MELLNDLLGFLQSVPPLVAYGVLLAIAYGENVVPPVPGDLAILYGGYLAGVGVLNVWPVFLLATVGGAAGFMTMYALGYRAGEAILDPNRLRWMPKAQVYRARQWIERWGWYVVAANRFLSGVRAVIALTVGVARMDARPTAVLATLSAVVWSGLIVYLGYALGDNLDLVKGWMTTYGKIMGSLLALAVLVWLVRLGLRRRKIAGSAGAG